METYTRVLVIGGGVVGCSNLFHLARFGWKDVVLRFADKRKSAAAMSRAPIEISEVVQQNSFIMPVRAGNLTKRIGTER